jgi:hypothetical protein
MIDANHHRPEWHGYIQAQQQRRHDRVDALAKAAGARAPDETARIKAEYHAARAAEKEFDAREPELGYEQFAREATA